MNLSYLLYLPDLKDLLEKNDKKMFLWFDIIIRMLYIYKKANNS